MDVVQMLAMQKQRQKKQRNTIIIVVIVGILVFGIISGVVISVRSTQTISSAAEYIASGNLKAAVSCLQEEINERGNKFEAYTMLAECYDQQGKYNEAIKILEKGVTKLSGEDSISIVRAKLEEYKNRYSVELARDESIIDESKHNESITNESRLAVDESIKEAEERAKRIADESKAHQNKIQYINECTTIDYKALARNPNKYYGAKLKFTGKVFDVNEPGFLSETTTILMSVTCTNMDYDLWEDTIYVTIDLPTGSDRILENDIITIYGDCYGLITYETVLGAKISVPGINVAYYSIYTN